MQEIMGAQKFDALSLDDMRACFELNTLGPIRVIKALLLQVKVGLLCVCASESKECVCVCGQKHWHYYSKPHGVHLFDTTSVECAPPGFFSTLACCVAYEM